MLHRVLNELLRSILIGFIVSLMLEFVINKLLHITVPLIIIVNIVHCSVNTSVINEQVITLNKRSSYNYLKYLVLKSTLMKNKILQCYNNLVQLFIG